MIPAFNEANSIAPLILEAQGYVDRVFVCDDGSHDATGKVAARMGATVYTHKESRGYGAAIRTLFDKALESDGGIFVTIDSGEPCLEYIPRFVDKIMGEKYDVVVGSRVLGNNSGVPPYRGGELERVNGLLHRSGVEVTDGLSGYRAYTRSAVAKLDISEDGLGVGTEILLKAKREGLNIGEIPVEVQYTASPTVRSLLRLVSINRLVMLFGVPGVVATLIALYFGVWTVNILTRSGRFSINHALITLGSLTVGVVLITSAVMLWVNANLNREK